MLYKVMHDAFWPTSAATEVSDREMETATYLMQGKQSGGWPYLYTSWSS